MSISFEKLKVGEKYERPYLAELWGYDSYHAISRGVVTRKDMPNVILFVTEKKQRMLTQYQDKLENGVLFMEGETSHVNDRRIVDASKQDEEIHLFHRLVHHSPFIYYGRIYLLDYDLKVDVPSRFIFAVGKEVESVYLDMQTEKRTLGFFEDEFISDPEGRRRLKLHVSYERSIKNRAKSIEINGSSCSVCGFNFDKIYGEGHARGFIEVHHIKPVREMEGCEVDPATDLVPLCSNCHRMAHREKNKVLTLSELKSLVDH